MISEAPESARPAAYARLRKDLAELDYRRELRRMAEAGFTSEQIAQWIWVPKESVEQAIDASERDLMLLEGFSGATPDEICRRYAVGQIDRAQLVDELVRFPYAKRGENDGYDWLAILPPGTWSEVSAAVRYGYIDDELYGEVFNLRHQPST